MADTDKVIKCRDCSEDFVFTIGEQSFYKDRGFQHEPTRCRRCRDDKKRQANGGILSASPMSNTAPREFHDAVCSSCGQSTQVPFRPTPGKPVYCRDCFQNVRGARGMTA